MEKNRPATEGELSELHNQLAKELTKRIKEGEVEVTLTEDDEGNVVENEVKKPVSPALLNTARQFLKDNNIEASPDSEQMHDLVDSLPFENEAKAS